jgi:purine-binding chemotaxis protein CheW
VKALLLPVGSDYYALAMTSVREVVAEPRVTPLPTAPEQVLGLFNLRGEIVPLFDTGLLLGLGRLEGSSFCAVVLTALGPAGLSATGLPEAAELGEPVAGSDIPGSVASYAVDDRLTTLLDVEAVMAPGAHWAE